MTRIISRTFAKGSVSNAPLDRAVFALKYFVQIALSRAECRFQSRVLFCRTFARQVVYPSCFRFERDLNFLAGIIGAVAASLMTSRNGAFASIWICASIGWVASRTSKVLRGNGRLEKSNPNIELFNFFEFFDFAGLRSLVTITATAIEPTYTNL
jgi:hypothetical protein